MSAPVESLQLHRQNIALSVHSGRVCESLFYFYVFLWCEVYHFFLFRNVNYLAYFQNACITILKRSRIAQHGWFNNTIICFNIFCDAVISIDRTASGFRLVGVFSSYFRGRWLEQNFRISSAMWSMCTTTTMTPSKSERNPWPH